MKLTIQQLRAMQIGPMKDEKEYQAIRKKLLKIGEVIDEEIEDGFGGFDRVFPFFHHSIRGWFSMYRAYEERPEILLSDFLSAEITPEKP